VPAIKTHRKLIGVIAGVMALAVFATMALVRPSAADREIEKLISENKDKVLTKLRAISAAHQQSRQERLDSLSIPLKSQLSPEEEKAETIRRFAALAPRPNFDMTHPEGNAVVMPYGGFAEVDNALAGRYRREWGVWYGTNAAVGEAIPKSAMCVGVVPRPRELAVKPDELRHWFNILTKVRYILLTYSDVAQSPTELSGDSFGGGMEILHCRLIDVETGHWLGDYSVVATSSSSVTVSTVKGEDMQNRAHIENALSRDLSSGMSGSFNVEFNRHFPWEK
jgi:hypothetical protein